MKYQEIKKQREDMTSKLMTDCRVFFAFSDSQYEEGKVKIAFREIDKEEKLVRIFGGGLMPSKMVDKFTQGLKDLDKWEKAEIKKHKAQDEQIRDELANYECYYTGDISDACRVLPYSRERIERVYREQRRLHNA